MTIVPQICSTLFVFQYASWDIAFQMVPYSRIDPNFAKQQIMLLLSEKYMNYNGQVQRVKTRQSL